jgi:hypothetical protein
MLNGYPCNVGLNERPAKLEQVSDARNDLPRPATARRQGQVAP